jgi:hypothetical protein
MKPLCRRGLAPPEQAPMEQLCGIVLEVDQDAQQPIFRGWQGTVLLGRSASPLPAPAMERPCGHVSQERRFKGGHQRRQLVHRQACPISHVRRLGGEIVIP